MKNDKLALAPNLEIKTVADLADWLEQNHSRDTRAWLTLYCKKHAYHLGYDLVTDLLISYGWIAGRIKRIDETKYQLYISPRQPGSTWCHSNQVRATKLIAAGKMTAFGRQVVKNAKASGSWDKMTGIVVDPLPADLQAALKANCLAKKNFASYTVSAKQSIIFSLNSAKTATTRQDRITRAVQRAAQNLRS